MNRCAPTTQRSAHASNISHSTCLALHFRTLLGPTDQASSSGVIARPVGKVMFSLCMHDGAQGYHVHDTSTNGTWIVSVNGHKVRVPKRESLPIRPGQTVRLSTLAEGADRNTVPECAGILVSAAPAAPCAELIEIMIRCCSRCPACGCQKKPLIIS